MSCYFITGTDTDVGKTVVAATLLRYFNCQGHSTVGFKPIAAGCSNSDNGLRNDDALTLQRHSSISVPYALVNPFAFEPPIAPHIAAKLCDEHVSIGDLTAAYQSIKALNADITLIEGAGGWCLPINDDEYLYQWVAQQQFEVIVVVGIKLGCLNHALLTQAFILSQGLKIAGWVANIVEPSTLCIEQNIATLQHKIQAPLLATIDYCANVDELEVQFDF